MCVDSSHNTIEFTDSWLDMESLGTLLNKFGKKGLNPLIFSQLKERTCRTPHPFRVIEVPEPMSGTIFA
jgi:hypothetical protein